MNLACKLYPQQPLLSWPNQTKRMDSIKQQFIWISRLEAISYLLLLGIAMPMKYMLDMPLAVKYVGWAHGALFVAYVVWLVLAGVFLKWSIFKMALGFIASLLPFGPFVFEKKMVD
jgi:integral membrane protein